MSSTQGTTKNQRREQARERAREERAEQQRRDRRRRVLLQGSIGLVVVALAAVIAVVIVNSVRPAGPGPSNMANGGITISGAAFSPVATRAAPADATPTPEPTADVVRVQVFEDFGCPYCRQFESANSAAIEAMVRDGSAEVQYFPVAILDRSFSDEYSTRAANAAAAVASWSPDAWFDFHSRLYAAQPEEGGAGLSDDRLIAIAKAAGADHLPQITTAIRDGRFDDWVKARTDEFSGKTGALADADIPAASVGATPAVLVNGRHYAGDPSDAAAFAAFVKEVTG